MWGIQSRATRLLFRVGHTGCGSVVEQIALLTGSPGFNPRHLQQKGFRMEGDVKALRLAETLDSHNPILTHLSNSYKGSIVCWGSGLGAQERKTI